MALKNLEAEALMQDARAMQAEGVRMVDAGDWRDGAGKGWVAVRNAAAAPKANHICVLAAALPGQPAKPGVYV